MSAKLTECTLHVPGIPHIQRPSPLNDDRPLPVVTIGHNTLCRPVRLLLLCLLMAAAVPPVFAADSGIGGSIVPAQPADDGDDGDEDDSDEEASDGSGALAGAGARPLRPP